MTFRTKDDAELWGRHHLLRRLGLGWQLIVWESDDWHCAAQQDGVSVYASYVGRAIHFSVYVNDSPSVGAGLYVGQGASLKAAFRSAIEQIEPLFEHGYGVARAWAVKHGAIDHGSHRATPS